MGNDMIKWISQRSLINFLLLTGFIVIIIFDIATYKRAQKLMDSIWWVLHTHQVLKASNNTLYLLTDSESKVSFYVLSRDKAIIKNVPSLLEQAQENILKMYQLTLDNPPQTIRIKELQILVNKKMEGIKRIIELENQGNISAASELAISPSRVALKANITKLINAINDEENRLLVIRNQAALSKIDRGNLMDFIFSALSGIMIIISLILLNYHLYQRNLLQRKQKYAENELRKSESYKTAILESASDCIITVNDKKNIISFNSKTNEEFKYTKEELQKLNVKNLVPSFDLNQADSLLDKSILEMTAKRKNGETFPVEIKISSMMNDNKKRFVMIIRNIEERKEFEHIKNDFVSVVSHELRTPITAIRGALGLILSGTMGELPEKIKKLLDLANNNCQRLLLLINDILDIEKIDAGRMKFVEKLVDINQIVQEAIKTNKLFAEKYDIELTYVGKQYSNLIVKADPDRLMQVLVNLISNAVKFSTKKEKVTLEIKPNKENVRILISNKGSGIPIEFQDRIFQKFSQADTSNTRGIGGTGLGLNISKAIIEKLGGTLNFTSKMNEETVFYFELPLAKENISIDNQISRIDKTLSGSENILICEDDEAQASYIAKLLEASGFTVDMAFTAKEARDFLTKKKYDVLLLDLILPDQDGIALIRELRNISDLKKLPIIVVSVIAQTGQNLLGGEAVTVIDWLDKPVNFKKLLESIERIKKRPYHKLHRILHVEDNSDTIKMINMLLKPFATISTATSMLEAIKQLEQSEFDLVILDLVLPDGNAEQLLPLFSRHNIPVIIYSAIEYDNKVSKTVKEAFLKSEISPDKLLNMIKKVLATTE